MGTVRVVCLTFRAGERAVSLLAHGDPSPASVPRFRCLLRGRHLDLLEDPRRAHPARLQGPLTARVARPAHQAEQMSVLHARDHFPWPRHLS
eukprot:3847165-Rhodomonas_salina.1